MANGHGGYRKPANPAPVSGPGAHSRRTDGRQPVMELSDAAYGEQAAFRDAQEAAPVPQTAPGGISGPPPGPPSVTGLSEPSGAPGEPVTSGAAYGPGPGPEALGGRSIAAMDAEDFKKYGPVLIDIAQRDDTPQSVKNLIRRMIAGA